MDGNYAQIAEGLGAMGLVVTEPGEIAGALRQAQSLNKDGKTVLIDIKSNEEGRRSNVYWCRPPDDLRAERFIDDRARGEQTPPHSGHPDSDTPTRGRGADSWTCNLAACNPFKARMPIGPLLVSDGRGDTPTGS